MLNIVRSWVEKYFSDEEAVVLFILLIAGLAVIVLVGGMLAPVIASMVLAFILQGLVSKLVSRGVNEMASIMAVYLLFIGLFFAFLFFLLPLVLGQVTALVKEFPRMFSELQSYIKLLPQEYPSLLSEGTVNNLFNQATSEAAKFGQWVVSFSIESFPVFVTVLIYIVLVPILVFFFLKDRKLILHSLAGLLPREKRLMTRVWHEMNMQFANYIRGKVVEILIVGVVTYIAFVVMGLNYAVLLGILVGLSVLVPYIGATIVTIPVAMIALFQWGWGTDFFYLMIVYGIIQALDGNVLVPLLFSEVVNLHPVVIIVAVLFFGGIWGLWGVFFAIPLATLLKAVFSAWPVAK
ncbi:AI-2E family transporter [Alkalimarinus sediminis]|uniref:AI-2E family transporter n=1 Tax=Alkalimarinus sediminis TaxID=1632866 RepID=A0A9E8HJI4_9ALTE|nr:AI-2E family transporter [Alkalimarinus sediminis]UZW75825.1 AI-2E family transporter [Alkalimarinus sediminis]